MQEERVLWEGKPSGIADSIKEKGGLNATTYKLTNERVIIQSGLLSKKQEEIELYKVKDIKVSQSMKERVMKIGQIELVSVDPTTPVYILKDVKNPNELKETIRLSVKEAKRESGVSFREQI
jgi:uncharacterized membrane protein YdbT with pleckstrin-like domain